MSPTPAPRPARVRLSGSIIGLICVFLLGGCATTGLRLDRDQTKDRNRAYARACAPFAMTCALAYYDLRDSAEAGTPEQRPRRDAFEAALQAQHWRRLQGFPPTAAAKKAGLYYDVWINESFRPAVLVIAVRGTQFTSGTDWQSNLWWFTRRLKGDTQYEICPRADEVGRVFSAYRPRIDAGSVVVITTGHSLGGGLAQRLRYAYVQDVRQCYVFNSSPVTGYSLTPENKMVFDVRLPLAGFPAAPTLRIYERGEILAYLRGLLRVFYPISDNIQEVRFDISTGHNPVGQHNMAVFAEKLVELAAVPPADPANTRTPWWETPRSE